MSTDETLARAYRRLLFAYPRRYRRDRERELIDTYLEAGSDRRRPSAGDAADLFLGGVRQRLRAAGLSGVVDGLPIAAVLALATAAAISVHFLLSFESATPGSLWRVRPFTSLAGLVYVGWLLTALTAVVWPGRPARLAAAGTFGLLGAVTVVAVARPPAVSLPPFVLLPLLVLGALAIAQPANPSWSLRLAPVGAAVATLAGVAATGGPHTARLGPYLECCDGQGPVASALHRAAMGLLVAALAAAVWYGRRRDPRGAWALLLLATPVVALESMWMYDLDPFRTIAYSMVGSNPVQVGIAGLLAVACAGVLLPLLVGGLVRVARARRADVSGDVAH
ncbi:hypothetical protein EV385_0916 [Krasilnikovia cinnamomea]|uniref:Uncharacterized protein n=1 Tax=Krasilnikovia cinnamomea TaxID=349313 RepID=A0A4Q7ZEM6_9ACTN|nr:hypothetical protein [Krasilnikovia cinnamomea]RZU49180.1 hypothetical protein EV385_0916 [Krasilnikovia cinnamomea]